MTDCTFPNEYVTAIEYQQYLRQYADRYGIIINRDYKVMEVRGSKKCMASQIKFISGRNCYPTFICRCSFNAPKENINGCKYME
jgi:hypothetical protein